MSFIRPWNSRMIGMNSASYCHSNVLDNSYIVSLLFPTSSLREREREGERMCACVFTIIIHSFQIGVAVVNCTWKDSTNKYKFYANN